MGDAETRDAVAGEGRGGLRLVWSRPPGLPPLPPRRRVNLAVAIERHLDGQWGVTDEQFALVFATTAVEEEEPAACWPGRPRGPG